jgi:hypothetical protein
MTGPLSSSGAICVFILIFLFVFVFVQDQPQNDWTSVFRRLLGEIPSQVKKKTYFLKMVFKRLRGPLVFRCLLGEISS